MAEVTPTGNAWQQRVNKLCTIQCRLCGEEYQPIPDQVGGDGGLEGCTTNGDGYQCYSDQKTINTAERTRKQKKKIGEDLAKLEKRRTFWEPYFGTKKLRRWFLVCPEVPDKAVLVHAQKHAKIIRDMKLPYIDDDFDVLVVTDDHFQMAQEWILKNGNSILTIAIDECDPKALAALTGNRPEFIANVDQKLRQVHPSEDDAAIFAKRKKYLESYLKSENALDRLNTNNPEIREAIDSFVASLEDTVRFESSLDDAKPPARLMAVRRTLSANLAHDFKNLAHSLLDVVSLGTVVAWLGECPLYFKEEGAK
jgi:hypothetical protein